MTQRKPRMKAELGPKPVFVDENLLIKGHSARVVSFEKLVSLTGQSRGSKLNLRSI